ncbi:MAG: type I-E CRISPR-associated protein Cse1/CasA [Bifidobacteriaceae bacterium]|nr:type I-E CRISPR-associated protein Cse1/CasA [Bifidobacteriaceae bacterium]
MSKDQFSYRLDQQPSVPARLQHPGRGTAVLSLRDCLARAHDIRGLSLQPLALAAVLTRVLAPLVIDIFGVPRSIDEWAERWKLASFDARAIDAYFAQHGERFDLFDPVAPFDQTPGLRTGKGELKPSSVLLPAVASGNSVPLFGSRTEAEPPPLDATAAFAALEVAQAYDTAAIKSGAAGDPAVKSGKTTGNHVGALGAIGLVLPQGRNLFETLMLNLPAGSAWKFSSDDAPHWRKPPPGPAWNAAGTPTGLLELLTWQSRRVRLVPEALADGSLAVRRVVLTAGDRLKEVPHWDPRTQWRARARMAPGLGPDMPVRHLPGRMGWRGLTSLLAVRVDTADERKTRTSHLLVQVGEALDEGHIEPTYPLDVLSVGVEYGNQSAVVESVMADALPLPVRALNADGEMRRFVLDAADQAETVRRALNRLESDLREACGGERIPGGVPGAGDAVVQNLDGPMRALMRALRGDPQDIVRPLRTWQQAAAAIALMQADSLLADNPPSAFNHRKPDGRRSNTTLARRAFHATLRKHLPLGWPGPAVEPAEIPKETTHG